MIASNWPDLPTVNALLLGNPVVDAKDTKVDTLHIRNDIPIRLSIHTRGVTLQFFIDNLRCFFRDHSAHLIILPSVVRYQRTARMMTPTLVHTPPPDSHRIKGRPSVSRPRPPRPLPEARSWTSSKRSTQPERTPSRRTG